jgi:DNA invertase Pin-like site-specific DNA recombinase
MEAATYSAEHDVGAVGQIEGEHAGAGLVRLLAIAPGCNALATSTNSSRFGASGLVMQFMKVSRPQLNALMAVARNQESDCVLVWKFDRFARSTRHLFVMLEEFDHLGVRFVTVQDQIDTESPMGRAMFTIIGVMAELESSLISERVTAGMRAAEARGRHLGRPATSPGIVREIEALAISTDLSVRAIQKQIAGRASRGIVGEITKRVRAARLVVS